LLIEAGLPTYETPEHAVRAFTHVVRFYRNQERLMETRHHCRTPRHRSGGRSSDHRRRAGSGTHAVDRAGIARRVGRLWRAEREQSIAHSPAEARQCAAGMNAPVALKILSPDITHKSDVGGVILGLATPAAVEAAAVAMLERVKAKQPAARLSGFTLEPMVNRPLAQELIVGVSEDTQFGPVILFGHGGVAVEPSATAPSPSLRSI
jgi:acetyltransferase